MSTPVSVDIYISNFFMLDKTGKMLKNFNNITNRLGKVELAMGYFGQFDNSLRAKYNKYGKVSLKSASEISISDLFDFSEDRLNPSGITLITMSDVQYVQTDSLPPDMTVHIHGFVGNYYSPSIQELANKNTLPTAYKSIVSKGYTVDTSKRTKDFDTFIGAMFFDSVTRNFVKESALSKKQIATITSSANFQTKNALSDSDAKKYGVIVYFSKGAKEWAKEYEENAINIDPKTKEKIYPEITVGDAETAIGKANLVINALGMKDFSLVPLDTNGCLFLYRKDEVKDMGEMLKGTTLKSAYKNSTVSSYWDNKLPAVYNITTDALCTVVSPFFFFINPFQTFEFKTRYALGGLVSYYANFNATEDVFYALWQTVSFATVENINECTIVCTGAKSE